MNSGVVVATGPGAKTKDGTLISCDVKSGDTVLLPEYGGTPIKLEGKESVTQFYLVELLSKRSESVCILSLF